MIVAKFFTAALLGAASQGTLVAQAPTHGAATHTAQPAPPPAGATGTTGPAAPAAPGHDMMMMKEMDKSIPGDSPIFKSVQLKIVSPKEGEVHQGSDMDITFKLTGYELPGNQPGPHVHVIIDNQPYQPDYDASKPFHVTGLSAGPHTIRAFPSRPWHESIKAPKAFAITHFFVGQKEKGKNLANWVDAKKPILTYSRPKGDYSGDDAKDVMVDFYVTNAKLGPKAYQVKMTLDGKDTMITEWKPQHLTGLADGKHTIVLDLLDKKGQPVANVFNHTEREFTVNGAGAAAGTTTAPAAQPDAGMDMSKMSPMERAMHEKKMKEDAAKQAQQPAPAPAPAPAQPAPATPPHH